MSVHSDTLGAALGILESKQDAASTKYRVAAIEGKIPSAASASNQLADKNYIDNSINAIAGYFRGTFETKAALMAVAWQTTDRTSAHYVSNNDFAYVEADETHNGESWRYAYVLQDGGQSNGWAAQYRIDGVPVAISVQGTTLYIIQSL